MPRDYYMRGWYMEEDEQPKSFEWKGLLLCIAAILIFLLILTFIVIACVSNGFKYNPLKDDRYYIRESWGPDGYHEISWWVWHRDTDKREQITEAEYITARKKQGFKD